MSINWKSRTTWTAIAAIVAAVGGYFTGEVDLTTAIAGILASLGAIFMRDAIKPAAAAILCLGLVGCQSLPADQSAKDEAGRSEVTQRADSTQNDLRNLLPRSMKIESPGAVTFTFNFYGNERSSDIAQTNSGSTTTETAKTQGQTQTPTSTPTVDTNVSGLPGQ